MNLQRLTALAVAVVIFGSSCKKEKNENRDVTFANQLSEKVTLDIYSSEKDYAANGNVVLRKVLPAGENTIIPGSTFADGATYYMDWYSDDYYYHNWFNDALPANTNSQVAFKPEPGNNTYYMQPMASGNARKTFLPGESVSSKWTAVNVYLYSKNTGYVSYWQQLTSQERFREITVNKDFKGTYRHQDSSGSILTETMDFMVHNSKEAYIEFRDVNKQILGSAVAGRLPSEDGTEYISSSTDSVMIQFPDKESFYFLMTKGQ